MQTIWKKDLRYNPYTHVYDWYYSMVVPENLTMSEHILKQIKYRKK